MKPKLRNRRLKPGQELKLVRREKRLGLERWGGTVRGAALASELGLERGEERDSPYT